MPTITRLTVDKWTIPQLQEVLQIKMNKGDIQAEFEIKDSIQRKQIKVNLKQLFILIQALIRVPGEISLEEINWEDEILTLPEVPGQTRISRELYICRDGQRIKDITHMCASIQDIKARDDARLIDYNWQKLQ